MKICLLSDQYESRGSGIGVHTNNMVEGLLNNNHEVILLCSDVKKKKTYDFKYTQIPVNKYDPSANHWFSLAVYVNKIIVELYKEHNFDLFHSLDARQGALAASKLKIPTIGSVNDYYYALASSNFMNFIRDYRNEWFGRYVYYNLLKQFERKTYNNYDLLIANSNATRDSIIENYNINPSKVKMIYKAIKSFPVERNKILNKDGGNYNILMVGFGLARKGIYHLMAAANLIRKTFPNVQFWIIGNHNKHILKKAYSLGIMDNFKFLGSLPPHEIIAHFKNADIFILPSLIEGFGVSVVEALSYGVPVIGTDVGGIKEIIDNGKNGLLIEPRSSRAIADAVLKLLNDFIFRKRISCNGAESAKRFNTEMQLKKTLEIYYAQVAAYKKHKNEKF